MCPANASGRCRHQRQRLRTTRDHRQRAGYEHSGAHDDEQSHPALLRREGPAFDQRRMRVGGREDRLLGWRPDRLDRNHRPRKSPQMTLTPQQGDREGFSIVEVLVAVTLLGVAMMSLAGAGALALSQLGKARQDLQYSADVQQVTDSLVGVGWNNVATGSSTIRDGRSAGRWRH